MLATYPAVWTDVYHQSVGIAGLNYISLMIGLLVSGQVAGRVLDRVYGQLKSRVPDGQGRPEFRVPILFGSTSLLVAGLFMYGWSAQAHTHWIVPNIDAAIFSAGANMTFTALQTYTIDCYQTYAASALGATVAARSATGFAFPLFGTYMFDALWLRMGQQRPCFRRNGTWMLWVCGIVALW